MTDLDAMVHLVDAALPLGVLVRQQLAGPDVRARDHHQAPVVPVDSLKKYIIFVKDGVK